jgi:hypothetical protein
LAEAAGERIWRAFAVYQDVGTPVHLDELQAEVERVEPPGGSMRAERGSGTPGDLYPFNREGLEVVLRATGTRLPDGWLDSSIDV